MPKRVLGLTSLLAAAVVLAQSPQDMLKLSRGDFDRLPATAPVSFEGRTWTKSELQANLDARRRKALPSGFDLESFETSAPRIEKQWLEQLKAEAGRGKWRSIRNRGAVGNLKPADGPTITEVTPEPLVVDCGGSFGPSHGVIQGTGFNEWATASLIGQFKGGPVQLKRGESKQLSGWGAQSQPPSGDPQEAAKTRYLYELPCNVQGVPDHDARIQVAAAGKLSNEFPVRFVAKRKATKVSPSWIQQTISSTADSSVLMRPKDFKQANGWELYGARHISNGLAAGTDTFKVVAPSPCSLVFAKAYWMPGSGPNSSAGFVYEKSRKLTANILELEFGWVVFGDSITYGVRVEAVVPAGLSCS